MSLRIRNSNEVSGHMARQILAVGILPVVRLEPIGKIFHLAGQPCVITGHATRQEFFQALIDAGMCAEEFIHLPPDCKFQKITTDYTKE